MKYDFIGTYTGKKLHFLDPKPEEICLEDIARALSHQCRYSGHTKRFYSVAEHSILVSMLVYKKTKCHKKALSALLHDATEAYLVDVPRPIKSYLVNYEKIESKLNDIIYAKFGIEPMCEYGHYIDKHVVRHEASELFMDIPDWVYDYKEIKSFHEYWCEEEFQPEFYMETFMQFYNDYKEGAII